MSSPIAHVLVIWADGDGRRHVIGDLWREGEGFAFAYRKDGVERAQSLGFHPLAEFPHLQGRQAPYFSKSLFPTFQQRIPPKSRADYRELLAVWGARSEDPLEILVKSGGILHTDNLEFAEYRAEDDELHRPLSFRLAGKRFANDDVELEHGQRLVLEREPGNPHDPGATIVLTLDGEQIGWVPVQYSGLISRLLDEGIPLRATIERRLLLPTPRGRWVVRVERDALEEPLASKVAEPSPVTAARSHSDESLPKGS